MIKNAVYFVGFFTLTILVLGISSRIYAPTPVPRDSPIEQEPQVDPPVSPILTLDQSLNLISTTEVKDWLTYLASDELEGRMSGKKGYWKAADFVEKKCQEWGLKTMRHRFNIQRRNSGPHNEHGDGYTENVYAYIEGSDPDLKNEVIVVGAHLDHIGYGPSMARDRTIGIHPGADDNASGSTALLATAKAFAHMGPMPRTIVFQWYSAEEMGLVGSRFYCDNPVFPLGNPSIRQHIAMINSDMIGRLGGGWYPVSWATGDSSLDLRRIVKDLNPKYSFADKITSHGSGGSDHACFYNKKVPVAFLHTGLHSDYHRVEDTSNKINYEGLTNIAKYTTELAYKVMFHDNRPTFNYSTFKPMPYTHDHGHQLFHSH